MPLENGRDYRVFRVVFGEADMPRLAYQWGGFTSGPFAIRQASMLNRAINGLRFSSDSVDLHRLQTYQKVLEDMKDAYDWNHLELPFETRSD